MNRPAGVAQDLVGLVPVRDHRAGHSPLEEGSAEALEVLYDRYHRQCFSLAVRMLGTAGEAEEAVQETFVRAWLNAQSYDAERAAMPAWLLAITRNLCIDELRRRKRRVLQLPELGDGGYHPAPDRTDLEAERNVIGAQVRDALQRLPPTQRRAIELVYFGGLTSSEVGEVLNVPSPTVRSRLRLGLLKMAGLLQENGFHMLDSGDPCELYAGGGSRFAITP